MTDHLEPYRALCASKRPKTLASGISRTPELNASLRDHQRVGVEFALRAGRSALFYDTGLGKTRMMLDWGRCVVEYTNKPVLMLAPLAVGAQHIREAEAMGVDAAISRFGQPPSSPKVVITNYERLEKFDPVDYAGVILDESSILKSFTGATTRKLISTFDQMP
ncbi:MAG: helicase, partial [Beijerinckiaceae bacterium]|nr:helicase [Beijerinckiaceae bacterium]